MYIAMALPLATFAAATFADAGKLTKANVNAALARYRFDGIIFPRGPPRVPDVPAAPARAQQALQYLQRLYPMR